MAEETKQDDESLDPAEGVGLIGRLRARAASNKRQTILVSLALASIVGGGIFGLLTWNKTAQDEEHVSLAMAIEALDRGHYSKAKEHAEKLRESGDLPPESLGGPAYVLGAATSHEGDDDWRQNKKRIYLLAARYLEEAKDRGFPPSRRAEGLYLMGHSLYQSGQFAECRQPLRESLREDKSRSANILNYLADASFRDSNPKLDEALKFNTDYLSDRRLSPEDRAIGTLRQSKILFKLGKPKACREYLTQIPENDPRHADAVLLEGQLALDDARALRDDPQLVQSGTNVEQATKQYNHARDLFAKAQGLDSLANSTTPQAMYLTSVCKVEMFRMGAAKAKEARVQLERTRTLFPKTSEGLAANLLEGDLEQQLDNPEAAVAAYLRALESIEDPRMFSNPWISLNDFRLRIKGGYRQFVADKQFESAIQMLEKYPPTFDKLTTKELVAETEHLWGVSELERAETLRPEQAKPVRKAGRRHLRLAGFIYARLAKMRITTRQYPEDLWNSADNLLRGQDYVSARNMLELYLKNESRRRRPQALVSMGKAQLALGDYVRSLEAFRNCIEFYPRDAAIYEARIWGSRAYAELGSPDKAQKLLSDNLTSDSLTPKSSEWQESLFLLGRYLHENGQKLFDEGNLEEATKKHIAAIEKLEEAVMRYPKSPHLVEAMYTIAEAHRLASREPEKQLAEATIESSKRTYRRRIREHMISAHKFYGQVQTTLNLRMEESELTEAEEAILRNCYMSLGSVLYHLGQFGNRSRYEEAIRAYENASARYQNEPIILEIHVQLANCYRRLEKYVEARGRLAQAETVLKRLDPDLAFEDTTNYTRDEWKDLLVQMSKW